MKTKIAMYKLKIKWKQSIFALLSGFFFLFFFSSSVLASPEELAAVKQQIQNSGARWQAAETSISKLPQEQRRMRLGFAKESFSVPEGTPVLSTTPAKGGSAPTSPPATLNYNLDGYVTPIRDQGNCGSCWAFGTTAALESQYLMSTNGVGWSTLALSPQILLSCSNAGNCSAGGYIDLASNFVQSTGLPLASCYPYTELNWTSGPDSPCSNAACPYWQSDTYSIKGWEWVATTAPTAAALESALNTYGPLVTTMNVYSDFYYYSGGIYSLTKGATYEGGHVIEIIGYNHTDQYFIVKNSWGPVAGTSESPWGVSVPGSVTGPGFFLIAYNQMARMTNVRYGGPEFGWYTIAYEGYKPLQNTCTYSISPKSVTVTYSGGSATVSVTSQSGCSWTSASNVNWISVVSGAKGTGDGTVKYSVQPNNTTKSWTGTLTIAGQTFTVTQQAK
jgi:C1A family cysteine protease